MFAPTYQELHVERSEIAATSLTCSTHASSSEAKGSIVCAPRSRMWAMQSAIQSTCCSIDWIMLASTEGLPGPVIMKKFGNPCVDRPR